MAAPPRIFLIHATPVSIKPARLAFEEHWPEARTFDLLDQSLSLDVAEAGGLDPQLYRRVRSIQNHAVLSGADGVLFTGSAFGPAIEAARLNAAIPVLKPDEAMLELACGMGGRICLLGTFAPSMESMAADFKTTAHRLGVEAELETICVHEARIALDAGDLAWHDSLLAKVAADLKEFDAIMLAHFSTARSHEAVKASCGLEIFTAPTSAVHKIRKCLD